MVLYTGRTRTEANELNTYPEVLEYLYQLPTFRYWQPSGEIVPPELGRLRSLLRRLNSPHKAFPSVHVAGTKGKGSVSAMVASILTCAGYRTGLYTSPHLHTFRERIQISGELIPEQEVVQIGRWLYPFLEAAPVTVFEAITTIAFEHFRRRGAEIAVLEVGMGGRFDATNVVRPLVSVITSIGWDHMNVLGNTIAEIAAEKAGIIKRGVPVVSAPQKEDAEAVLRATARQRRARQVWVGRDWRWEARSQTLEGQQFTVLPPKNRPRGWASPLANLFIPLLGPHQVHNATAAVAAVAQLERRGVRVGEDALRRGLAEVKWPARVEVLQSNPWLVVDAAHTVESVEAALSTIRELFGRAPDVVIFGVYADKDVAGMLSQVPQTSRLILSQAAHPRAMDVAHLRKLAESFPGEILSIASPREALERALAEAAAEDVILVIGSLFLAAEARADWYAIRGLPMPPHDTV